MRLAVLVFAAGLALATHAAETRTHRITIAQLKVTRDVDTNLAEVKKAFDQAGKENANWIVFPEGMLSGYYGNFDQQKGRGRIRRVPTAL
ncbi:MAG: hypothetical protein CMO80_14510 [Verrucomicrobiales bacterium]|nr:hypothetical protein [Verrucomicrobiales bacterium]|tara:strand:+ start:5104 stop:5373 length:270 start_codon:yes stop_codon:yes gene_type:complete